MKATISDILTPRGKFLLNLLSRACKRTGG